MSTHNDALSLRIEQTQREIRRHEEAGHRDLAVIEQARCEGMLFAQRLLFGDDQSCPHHTHRYVGLDERGKSIWQCNRCDAVAP